MCERVIRESDERAAEFLDSMCWLYAENDTQHELFQRIIEMRQWCACKADMAESRTEQVQWLVMQDMLNILHGIILHQVRREGLLLDVESVN